MAKVKKFLLYLFLAITPFFVFPFVVNNRVISLRKAREIFFYSAAIILTALWQKNRWVRYFVIWCVIVCWFNLFRPAYSYQVLNNILAGLLVYVGIQKFIRLKWLSVNGLLIMICLSVIFQLAWLIVQWLKVDPIFYTITGANLNASWSENHATFAIFLACNSFLFLKYFKVKGVPVFFFIICAVLLCLNNFTSVLCLSVGSLFYLIIKQKLRLICIVIILLILYGIYLKPPNIDRWAIWGRTPMSLFGSGLSSFARLGLIDYTGTWWREAHNEYLQLFHEVGLVGLILFLGIIISQFRQFFKQKDETQLCIMSCLVAYLVSAFSYFPFHIAQIAFYILILWGCASVKQS